MTEPGTKNSRYFVGAWKRVRIFGSTTRKSVNYSQSEHNEAYRGGRENRDASIRITLYLITPKIIYLLFIKIMIIKYRLLFKVTTYTKRNVVLFLSVQITCIPSKSNKNGFISYIFKYTLSTKLVHKMIKGWSYSWDILKS